MKNSLEQLVKAGLIKPFEGSASQVKARLELAKRDLRVAKATMAFYSPQREQPSFIMFPAQNAPKGFEVFDVGNSFP
jgi:hypothetical protein